MSKTITDWAHDIYDVAVSKGWHDNDHTLTEGEKVAAYVANIHGEASELWEAYRAGKLRAPCDKAAKMAGHGITPLTCVEEELADVIIRALDDAMALGVDIEKAIAAKHEYNKTRPQRHGGKLA